MILKSKTEKFLIIVSSHQGDGYSVFENFSPYNTRLFFVLKSHR